MHESNSEDSELASLDDSALLSLACREEDEDIYWKLVHELHNRGTEQICTEAIALCDAVDPIDRATAADVLGQLGWSDNHPFADRSLPVLISLVGSDRDTSVIDCAITALGHLGDRRALDAVVGAAHHANADVRHAVASALPALLSVERVPPDHPAVRALIELTTDPDSDVRDWATFGLCTRTNTDGEQIRRALLDRLFDTDATTREEAMVGLAKRRDRRVLPYVLGALQEGECTRHILESASFLAAEDLLSALTKIDSSECTHGDELAMAIRRCDPAQQAAEVQVIADFVNHAAEALPGLEITVSCDLFGFDGGGAQVNVGSGSQVSTYDFDSLLDRAGNSIVNAVERIAEDNAAR